MRIGVVAVVLATSMVAPWPARSAPGTVEGTIFRDHNANGVRDGLEPGQPGVEVRAHDAAGNVAGPAVSGPDGRYAVDLAPLTGGTEFRIAATIPTSLEFLQPGPVAAPATPGAIRNMSTVRFAAANGPLAPGDPGVDFGVADPRDYCQPNPDAATPCYTFGPAAPTGAGFDDNPALVRFPFDSSGELASVPDHDVARFGDLGSVLGLAQDPSTPGGWIAATFIKRHAGIEREPGTIFRVAPDGAVTELVTLPAGIDTHPADTAPLSPDWLLDRDTWDAVGKLGLGDIELSSDLATLFVVNLEDRALYRVELAAPASFASTRIPAPAGCAPADWRPFGLGVHDGRAHVGGVCTNQSSGLVDANFAAHVYRAADAAATSFEPAPVLSFALSETAYPRKCGDAGNPPDGRENDSEADNDNDPADVCRNSGDYEIDDIEWRPWLPAAPPASFAGDGDPSNDPDVIRISQPWLTDIGFDARGDMILGMRSRTGDQLGNNTPAPGDTDLDPKYIGAGMGDVLKACRAGAGWQLEDDGACGADTGAGAANREGPGGGEFFNGDDHYFHDQLGFGGVLALPTTDLVADVMFDPFPQLLEFFDGGVTWHRTTTGVRTRELRVYDGQRGDVDTGGKANGLGDLEAWCEPAPLQIGDRVWLDGDRDGIQDPGEAGLEGVGVTLTGPAGSTTATTGADGRYVFPAAPGTAYTLSFDLTNVVGQDPARLRRTTSGAGPDDAADSDLTEPAPGVYEIAVPAAAAGHNDHTFDAGFVDAPERIGNLVWRDADRDGTVDAAETGISGVTVELWRDDGDTAFDPTTDTRLATTTTDPTGEYWFDLLRGGAYFVAVPSGQAQLAGTRSTAPASSTSDDNDNNGTASAGYASVSNAVAVVESAAAPLDETDVRDGGDDEAQADNATSPHHDRDSNLTIDLGFVDIYAIGNQIWRDDNDNGTRDPNEPPLPNVTVNLLDNTGTPLATTTTGPTGLYTFDNLNPADYILEIPATNFSTGQPLDGMRSSTPTTTTDNQTDNDDNGTPQPNGSVRSPTINLTGNEPTNETPTSTTNALDANTDLTIDFGFVAPAAIGNLVWFDTDGDGVLDPGEEGVGGVTVRLLDDGGSVVATTTTASDGTYLFSDLAPATYSVRFELPGGIPGLRFTAPDAGGSDAVDSDADPASGRTAPTDLAPGERDLTWDAGIVVDAAIRLEKQVRDPDDASVWYNADSLDGESAPDDRWVGYLRGARAVYRFVVTNPGPAHLTDVVLDDPTPGTSGCPSSLAVVASGTSLAPGASVTVTPAPQCQSPPIGGPFANTAAVTAAPAAADGRTVAQALSLPPDAVRRVADDDPAEVRPVDPRLEIIDITARNPSASDASATATARVRNTSTNVPELHDVVLWIDTSLGQRCDPASLTGGDADGDGRLDAGEVWSYDCVVRRPPAGWPASWDATASATATVPAVGRGGYPLPRADAPTGTRALVLTRAGAPTIPARLPVTGLPAVLSAAIGALLVAAGGALSARRRRTRTR